MSIFIEKHSVYKILYLDDFEFLINEKIIDQKMINLISNYFKSKKNKYI